MNFDANPRMGRHLKAQFYYSEWFILKTELYDGQSLVFLWNFWCCFFPITDWMFVVWWNAINSWVHYEIRIDFSLFRDLFEEMNNPTTLIYSIFHNFLVTKKKIEISSTPDTDWGFMRWMGLIRKTREKSGRNQKKKWNQSNISRDHFICIKWHCN